MVRGSTIRSILACPDDNLLLAYAEGNLSVEERARVAQHLDTCPSCRSLLSDVGRADSAAFVLRGTEMAGFLGAVTADPAAAPHVFAEGELVAGRYRIVRFIAHGGMGEVYEAADEELKDRVALKTVLSDIAADQQVLRRFKREILIARRVTHPNVCRIFDVGFHQRTREGKAEKETITFLTMEMLSGDTLRQRLRARGRMTPKEALPLVRQLAAALQEAHKAGVIHRDFKSANIFLVPTAGGEDRVVITDFGLASSSSAGGDGESALTARGAMLGTPAYMAPEQVNGGVISAATDIYALGVVLYEMVTAKLPFVADTPLALATRRLTEAPTAPRDYNPGLEEQWERVILRCLERDPAARFPDAQAVVQALCEGEGSPPPRNAKKRRARWVAVGLGGVLAALAAVGYPLLRGIPERIPERTIASHPGARSESRRSVAVLGFKNVAGRPEAAWLSTALSEMLTTELAASEKLRTIPGELVTRMKSELRIAEADGYAKDTLAKIRAYLGADLVVLGSFVALGQESNRALRLDLRLQDAATGEVLLAMADSGSEADLFYLASHGGEQLRKRLGLADNPPRKPPGIDMGIIRGVVREHIAEVKDCFESELEKQRNLAGKVMVGFTIGSDGTVTESRVAETTLGNRFVEQCIVNAVHRWRFPKPASGEPVVVTYPFVLRGT